MLFWVPPDSGLIGLKAGIGAVPEWRKVAVGVLVVVVALGVAELEQPGAAAALGRPVAVAAEGVP